MICSLFLLVFKYTMDVSQLVLQCDLGMGGGGGGGGGGVHAPCAIT